MPNTRQGSFHLFRLAGIDVFLHWSWFVVAAFEINARGRRYPSIAWNVAEYLSLFLVVTLHEFGHALACRQVGGTANKIVLWPLGGVAYVDPPPRPAATLKVWDALCPLDAIVCLGCFGKRLNPANPPQDQQHLGAEIRRQRKRFKLKNVNRWLGEKRNGEVYRGRYLVLLDWEPKAAETVAGLDEEMLKKGMTSKRVHERNAAAQRVPRETASTPNEAPGDHASPIAAMEATQVAVGRQYWETGADSNRENPTALHVATS